MTEKQCERCDGTGFVPSGMRTDIISGAGGQVLVLPDSVPIQMPCPRCAADEVEKAGD